MNKIYIVLSNFTNHSTNDVRKIESCHFSLESAMFSLVEDNLKKDLEYGDFWKEVKYTETRDENDKEVKNGEELPDKLKYFLAYDDADVPEIWLEYWIEEYPIINY